MSNPSRPFSSIFLPAIVLSVTFATLFAPMGSVAQPAAAPPYSAALSHDHRPPHLQVAKCDQKQYGICVNLRCNRLASTVELETCMNECWRHACQ
jgi:hypothetical protein